MRITVNGDVHDLPDPCRVEELLVRLGLPGRGVALAVNGTMLPRSQWATSLEDGWTLEVLTAVQGG
ncbi:sulfur carrier protein ThiS [Rhodococcus sp. NPDC056960]|uniref:sulfur carrier protein ThiS n=1 Tax=Rhodococcus sp. NPDC056960 TaxID=3345982 RepID=UPI003639339B